MPAVMKEVPELIYLHNPWNVEQAPCGCGKDTPYVPSDLLTTKVAEARQEAFKEAGLIVRQLSIRSEKIPEPLHLSGCIQNQGRMRT